MLKQVQDKCFKMICSEWNINNDNSIVHKVTSALILLKLSNEIFGVLHRRVLQY